MRSLPHESPSAPYRRARAFAPVYMHAAGSLASGVGGGALAVWGLRRKGFAGRAAALAGGALAVRAAAGALPLYRDVILAPVRIVRSITVNKPPEEAYNFWRNPENLPRFLSHVQSAAFSNGRIQLTARRRDGRQEQYELIVDRDVPGQFISWHSAAGARMGHAGSVGFRPAPGGRGAEVIFEMAYRSPVGEVSRLIGKLRGRDPASMAASMLRRFKQVIETGEIPTTQGQPRGA